MIVSVDKCPFYKVYLNGNELTNCYYADDERGEAECYLRDENGNYALNAERTEVVREKCFGHVEIKQMHCRAWYWVYPIIKVLHAVRAKIENLRCRLRDW